MARTLVTHLAVPMCHIFVLTSSVMHYITENMNLNMESICQSDYGRN